MNNLLIIGNGFDLFHNLETKYSHFYRYLCDEYNINVDEIPDEFIIRRELTHSGNYEFAKKDLAELMIRTIINSSPNNDTNAIWSNLEEAIGELEYFDYLSQLIEFTPNDEYGELNRYNLATYMQQYSEDLKDAFSIAIKTLFSDWVYSINVTNCQICPTIQTLINNCQHILSFNYTKTVEEKYNRENIIHIHGSIGFNDEFILGHCNHNRDFNQYDQDIYFNSAYSVEQLHNCLLKDTSRQMQNYNNFFTSLSNESIKLNHVESIGFSYGRVDLPYIANIISHTNTDTKWILYMHDVAEFEGYRNKILAIGFTGEVICNQLHVL